MRGDRDGIPLPLGSPQQQAVLAALLLKPGRWVSMEGLIDALWGDGSPPQARATVRTYVWRLRGILETSADEPDVLVSYQGGYRLVLDAGATDVHRAEELAAGAERARSAGLLEEARGLLGAADDLWQGEPLAGVPGTFAEMQRHRLTEFRLTLLEERIGLDVALGRAARCVAELSALTAEYPLREGLYSLLMQALTQAGRQGEALEVFRRARQMLIDELGMEPAPDLLALYRRILDRDPGLAGAASHRGGAGAAGIDATGGGAVAASGAGVPAVRLAPAASAPALSAAAEPAPAASAAGEVFAAGASPVAPAGAPGTARAAQPLPTPAQLPPDELDFTGRCGPIAELHATLRTEPRTGPVVAVVAGMGGVGKTTLALHVAHQLKHAFPDGQLYADLRGGGEVVATPESVATGFLHALGAPAEALPDGLAARSALFRSMVEGRRLLIVLDNVRDTAQVRSLLPGTASCAVLATSRTRLSGLPAARQIDLSVFEPPEALSLLEHVIGTGRLEGEPEAARDLVAACGFLPLAVRIVAARLAARPGWTIGTLLDRLVDGRRRIDELRVGDLAVGACFELGYRQLDRCQAEAFRLVAAVDVADLSLSSAAALIGVDERTADDLLESLADVAMLESHGPGRYRHHDLLRAFALHRSEQAHPGEAAAARARMLGHLLATARAAFEFAVPGDPVRDVLVQVESGRAPLSGLEEARCWAAAETDGALALTAQIARAGLTGETPAEPECGATTFLRMGADLLIALSPFALESQRHEWAATARLLVLAAVQGGDRTVEGRARFLLGNIATAATWLDEAEQESRLAADVCREVGDTLILRQTLNDLGLLAQFQGRFDEAVGRYDEAIALARQLGHRSGECVSTLNAAVARVRAGRAEEAVADCEGVLVDQREAGDRVGEAKALYVLGLALHRLGRHGEAAERFAESLRLWTAVGPTGREAPARYRLADALLALGRAEEALPQVLEAVRVCEATGQERDQGHALMVLARVLRALERTEEACGRARQAYELYRRLGLPEAAEAERLSRVEPAAPVPAPAPVPVPAPALVPVPAPASVAAVPAPEEVPARA
ncbi:BTAD domain-containing putative transcriptional regulator [Streptacidiphilus sp. EB129]|uniref:AfsR/SARP family transcriptional regulator n=1 Tax=Streptacidiphilus sp. EB129 TaxID=3156262 RepID=UPI0035133F99